MPADAELPLDAVTFDFWNTLCYEPDVDQRRELVADAWCSLLSSAGVDLDRAVVAAAYDEVREEYWAAWRENRQFTGTDAARMAIARLGSPPGTPELEDELVAAFHACSEVAAVEPLEGIGGVLEALRDRGVRVGIVCDVGFMASPYLRSHLARHGLLDHFDHWSFSDEVGVYKPHRQIFEHALDGLGGVAPERAAHVGDRRRTDVAGATCMGMRTVRITSVFDDDDPDEGPSGDAVIGAHGELLDALASR